MAMTSNVYDCYNCRYNGSLVGGDGGRKRSKFSLCKRAEANGVKPSKKQFIANPKEKKVSVDNGR